ncbi:MAG: DUF3558 family protein [Thermomonas sp.]
MRRATLMVAVIVMMVAGCKPEANDAAKPKTSPEPAAPAAVQAPAVHPCALLADASVARVLAQAQPGKRDTADEASGISTCRWAVGDGAVVLQTFVPGPGALPRELRGSTLDIVDLQRKDAASLVRLEKIDGVGDLAGAFVEREDAKRGIRRSGAVLMVQRGDRLAVLRIPQLAQGDRDQALVELKSLGTEIAKAL